MQYFGEFFDFQNDGTEKIIYQKNIAGNWP